MPSMNAAKDEIMVQGTTYQVVKGKIPAELAQSLVLDFSENERHAIFHRINMYQAQCHQANPKVLWIFGPPAVGKSTLGEDLARELFGCPENAVTVDGAEFRAEHKGFQKVTEHGLMNRLLHADAWKTLKGTGCMDRLKEEIVQMAISNRQHLKIPETALNTDRVDCMMDQLTAAGYEVHAVSLWAPKSETEVRGRSRSAEEGKAFATTEYDKAAKNALAYCQQWTQEIVEGSLSYKSVAFYDNTVFPIRQVCLSEFTHLTQMSDAAADEHAANKHAEAKEHAEKAWTLDSRRSESMDSKGRSDLAAVEEAAERFAQEAWTPCTWRKVHAGQRSML